VLDQWFDLRAIAADIAKRPYITVGFTAFLMLMHSPSRPRGLDASSRATLAPAAPTRLSRRDPRLRALLVAGQADWREPAVYAVVLAMLLAWRIDRARVACSGRPRRPGRCAVEDGGRLIQAHQKQSRQHDHRDDHRLGDDHGDRSPPDARKVASEVLFPAPQSRSRDTIATPPAVRR